MYLLAHVGLTVLAWLLARRLLSGRLPEASLVAVAAGSLLPDLVDKPLGHLVLGWPTGRLYAHAALPVLLLGALAWGLRARAPRVHPWLAALAFGSAAHLLLDAMWREPAILLWPLLGPMPHGDWAPARYLAHPVANPWVLVMEGVGLLVLLGAPWVLRGPLRGVATVKDAAPLRRTR